MLLGNRIVKKILLATASILFTLFIAGLILEIYLRQSHVYVIDPSKGPIQTDMDYIEQTPKGKRLRPNSNVIIKNHPLSHLDVTFKTDSHGFRNKELSKNKKPDTVRILVLGDSITQAEYLNEDQVYVSRMKDYLQEKEKDKPIEVANAAVGDIGLEEEIDILEERGLKINPDIVLIEFYLNDSRPPWGFIGELGRPNLLRRYSVLIETVYRNLKLRQFIKEKGLSRMEWATYQDLNWEHDREIFLQFAEIANLDWGAAWKKDSWTIVEKQLNRLKSLSDKHNFKVVIAIFPVRYQLFTDFVEDYPQKMMQELAARYGFRSIDLLPVLRENRNFGLYFDYCHPSIYGNEIIGKEIAKNLITNSIIE